MQGSYVLTIVQLLNQLKNANTCITQIFLENFSEKYIFKIFMI